MLKTIIKIIIVGLLPLLSMGAPSHPGSAKPLVTPIPPVATTPPERHLDMSFKALGAATPLALRGIEGNNAVGFGLRLDELVTAAHLTLDYDYSPALLPAVSHIKIYLNDEIVGVITLPPQWHSGKQKAEFDIDPRYFTDFNRIRFQLIGHYSMDCEDPGNSSLWASISNTSQLKLTLQPLPTANDLAQLPAPFFDRRDGSRLTLPIAMAPQADMGILRAAGVAASWFGSLATYRGARFPLATDGVPDRHALVLGTVAQHPAFLDDWLHQHPLTLPTLTMIDAPGKPDVKLLLLLGRDDAQLKLAIDALVLGQVGLSGDMATVHSLQYGPPRQAYDSPNWIPTDRPVRFGELVENPTDLQVAGHLNPPLRVNLSMPPDLFPWRNRGVPLDLRFRYTPPVSTDNSTLNVSLNEQFVQSFRLRGSGQSGDTGKLTLPILDDGTAGVRERLNIPAFRLGGDNQMQFEFRIDLMKKGGCENAEFDNVRAGIDPESTLDLSGFPHFTTLPNLAFFANSAYPFSRYADLSQTALVLPDHPSREALEAFLFIMGRMGRATGYPALRYRLVSAAQLNSVRDADLVWIAATGRDATLAAWGEHLPALVEGERRRLETPYRLLKPFTEAAHMVAPEQRAAANGADLEADGPLAAIVGFESPLQRGRSIVAISASSPAALGLAEDALEDPGLIDAVRGHVTLIRGRHLDSYTLGATYDLGTLPWWMRVWVLLSRHPLILTLVGLVSGLLLGASAYTGLRKVAQRRLQGG